MGGAGGAARQGSGSRAALAMLRGQSPSMGLQHDTAGLFRAGHNSRPVKDARRCEQNGCCARCRPLQCQQGRCREAQAMRSARPPPSQAAHSLWPSPCRRPRTSSRRWRRRSGAPVIAEAVCQLHQLLLLLHVAQPPTERAQRLLLPHLDQRLRSGRWEAGRGGHAATRADGACRASPSVKRQVELPAKCRLHLQAGTTIWWAQVDACFSMGGPQPPGSPCGVAYLGGVLHSKVKVQSVQERPLRYEHLLAQALIQRLRRRKGACWRWAARVAAVVSVGRHSWGSQLRRDTSHICALQQSRRCSSLRPSARRHTAGAA